MENLVAFPKKGDQVGLCVVSKVASPSHMMNVEISEGSAFLAAPPVAFQDNATQPRVYHREGTEIDEPQGKRF